MLTLYDSLPSGNGYKVRMLLAWLARPFERVEVPIFAGGSRTPEFLRLNPNGRIPVLVDGEAVLAESDAILWYLAEGTPYLPGDRLGRAQVLQWMFFEQYNHEPTIAVVRSWLQHKGRAGDEPEVIARRQDGYAALGVMEQHLADRAFFVGDGPTIADIALYAYTHVAPEGGFDLAPYSAVRAWCDRVARTPNTIPITQG